MVIYSCIAVFYYTIIRVVIDDCIFNMMRISMKRVSVELVKYNHNIYLKSNIQCT